MGETDRGVVAIVGITVVMTGAITEEGRPRVCGCDVVDVEKTTRRLTAGKKTHATIVYMGSMRMSTAPAAEQSSTWTKTAFRASAFAIRSRASERGMRRSRIELGCAGEKCCAHILAADLFRDLIRRRDIAFRAYLMPSPTR